MLTLSTLVCKIIVITFLTRASTPSRVDVRVATEPVERNCVNSDSPVILLVPNCRSHCEEDGRTASHPSSAAKGPASVMMIFVPFAMFRSPRSFRSAIGAARVLPLGNTRDTPDKQAGPEMGRAGSAALNHGPGCTPLCLRDFRRFAGSPQEEWDVRRHSALRTHTPRPGMPRRLRQIEISRVSVLSRRKLAGVCGSRG